MDIAKKLLKPEVVAFDLDYTIYDVIHLYQDYMNVVRLAMGEEKWLAHHFDDFYQNGYVSTSEAFRIMFGDQHEKSLQHYFDLMHSNHFSREYILPYADKLLKYLKDKSIKVIAVTNSEQHLAKKILRDIGLYEYFESITGFKQDRNLKPHSQLLEIGLHKIHEKPSKKVWFIGDSATDTICASAAGCSGIRYYFHQKPIDEYADAFYNNHQELLDYLESIL